MGGPASDSVSIRRQANRKWKTHPKCNILLNNIHGVVPRGGAEVSGVSIHEHGVYRAGVRSGMAGGEEILDRRSAREAAVCGRDDDVDFYAVGYLIR